MGYLTTPKRVIYEIPFGETHLGKFYFSCFSPCLSAARLAKQDKGRLKHGVNDIEYLEYEIVKN